MTPETIDIRHEQYRKILDEATDLENLAHSFSLTGNAMMGQDLADTAWRLRKAVAEMRLADGKELDHAARRSAEASKNMLNACLAGAAIAVRDCPRDEDGERLDGTERLIAERKERGQ